MINIEAQVSTNPYIMWLFISTNKCMVLLWFWFMLILLRLGIVDPIVVAWFNYNTSSLFCLANFNNLSKYFNSLGIVRMVPWGSKISSFLSVGRWYLTSCCCSYQSRAICWHHHSNSKVFIFRIGYCVNQHIHRYFPLGYPDMKKQIIVKTIDPIQLG